MLGTVGSGLFELQRSNLSVLSPSRRDTRRCSPPQRMWAADFTDGDKSEIAAQPDRVKIFELSNGQGINSTDENGWTCLMWAARFNRMGNAVDLLRQGAKVGCRSKTDVWRYRAGSTAADIADITQGYDGQDRSSLVAQLRRGEHAEARQNELQTAYNQATAVAQAAATASEREVSKPDFNSDLVLHGRTAAEERARAVVKAKALEKRLAEAEAKVSQLEAEVIRLREEKRREVAEVRAEHAATESKLRQRDLLDALGMSQSAAA
jgi:hypothetical protein